VKTLSDSAELRQLALHSEAACEMMLNNPKEITVLLENEVRYSPQPSVSVILSQAYQMLGKMEEAKSTLQDSILDRVIGFFNEVYPYLAICTDDINHFEEICRRTNGMIELFNMKKLNPISVLPFYLTAAEGYLTLGNTEKSLAMLEVYAEVATDDIFPLAVKGDDFFTLVAGYRNKQLNERPYGMPEYPRDEQSVKQEIVDTIIINPAFSALHENKQFQDLTKRLKQML